MNFCFNPMVRHFLMAGVAVLAVAPSIAQAQASNSVSPGTPDNAQSSQEIVVTGTSLRKVAPAGSETITIDQAEIRATGASSTDQLLAKIPQLSSFGTFPSGGLTGGTALSVNRTNLRNLPQGVGGGSPTLVLLDGHTMVGMGVLQSYPDPDVIPPALIERVEVLTDGGSAVYGANAIGGVINFITKRDFSGIDVGVRQGLGKDYRSTDVNVTTGRTWDGGGLYIGYNYSGHDPLYGYDRSYVKDINWVTGLPASLYCSPGNVQAGGQTYAVVGGKSLVLSNANLCDDAKAQTIYPKEIRHSVMAGFHQELAEGLEFGVKGYFSQRTSYTDIGPLTGSATLGPSSPGYISTGDANSAASQAVYFNFSPVGGDRLIKTSLRSWGVTPTLTWKFGHDWQIKAYYNYGESRTTVHDPQVSQTALGAGVAAGTINPYNVAASNSAALGQVLNYTSYGIGKDQLGNAKVTLDGPLFNLPGGEIRVAVGGEISHEKFQGTAVIDTFQNVSIAPLNRGARTVKSGFAELNLPVVGPANEIPFIYSFTLSAAERYDNYSDFGGNWAPNIGITFKPVSWIGIRARWNRAFQAPSLVQIASASTPQATVVPSFYYTYAPLLINPAVPLGANPGPFIAVSGTVSPLQPERARDYNLGIDLSPPMLKGLNIHVTYWNINYSGQIASPPLGYGVFWGVPTYEKLVVSLPTQSQISAFLANANVPATGIANALAELNAQGGNAYYVVDTRSRNLGVSKVHGIDISFDYQRAVSFGSVYARFNSSLTQSARNAVDGINFGTNQAGINGTKFNSATVVGATVGENVRGQLTWNHLAGFSLSTPTATGQSRVGAFNTFDLYAQYEWKQKSLPPITLELGITNVLNTNPPIFEGTAAGIGTGTANGQTLGRVFQLGMNVKF